MKLLIKSKILGSFKGEKGEEKLFFILILLGGATSGIVAVFLEKITHFLTHYFSTNKAFTLESLAAGFVLILLSGLLTTKFFKEASGSGIPNVRIALAVHHGKIRFRDTVAKVFATILSLGSGMSLGLEGPTVRISSGLGSKIGGMFHLSKKHVKTLVATGCAGGIAAAFNTPIAAVLFTLEEVVGNLNSKILGPIIISSVIASVVGFSLRGNEPTFASLHYQIHDNWEFVIYLVVGIASAVLAPLWARLILFIREKNVAIFKGHQLTVILITFFVMAGLSQIDSTVLGTGKESIVEVLLSKVTDWKTLALLFVLKFFATALCFASGVSGGIFLPTLFLGATLGGLIGALAQSFLPTWDITIGAYALVGMGAFFISVIRAPFTSIIMIFEMTRDYSIIVPLMIANISSYLISQKFFKGSIYEALSEQDGIHLPSREDDEVLEALVVEDAMVPDPISLGYSITVKEAMNQVRKSEISGYPILKNGQLFGILATSDIGQAFLKNHGEIRLEKICKRRVITIYPDQSLLLAFHRLKRHQISRLPVVSRINNKRVLGIITAEDIVNRFGYHIEEESKINDIEGYEAQFLKDKTE